MGKIRRFKALTEDSGARHRYVAAESIDGLWVFLAHLSTTALDVTGPRRAEARFELFALARAWDRSGNYLSNYEFKLKGSPKKLITIKNPGGKRRFDDMDEIEWSLLADNVDVRDELRRLYSKDDTKSPPGRMLRRISSFVKGHDSEFFKVFRCGQWTVLVTENAVALGSEGAAEIETEVWADDIPQFKIDSLMQVVKL